MMRVGMREQRAIKAAMAEHKKRMDEYIAKGISKAEASKQALADMKAEGLA